jgi:putative FmdB family regulatory protein
MPIYEYRCEGCHRSFEVWQKVSEGPVQKCEHCGSKKVSKLISQTSFQLKGSGWYITDYARKGKSGSGEKNEAGAKASEGTKAGKDKGND